MVSNCKNNYDPCAHNGTVKDLLGQDNCTLVIDDENGDRYVPNNINEFGLVFYDGQNIKYSFKLDPDGTPCNIGVGVTILCIQAVK